MALGKVHPLEWINFCLSAASKEDSEMNGYGSETRPLNVNSDDFSKRLATALR